MYQNLIHPHLERAINSQLKGNNARVILHMLKYYYNKENHVAWPKQQTIADDLGISLRSVERAIHVLKERGTINIKRTRLFGQHGPYDRNTYTFPRITVSGGLLIPKKTSIDETRHDGSSVSQETSDPTNCRSLNKGKEVEDTSLKEKVSSLREEPCREDDEISSHSTRLDIDLIKEELRELEFKYIELSSKDDELNDVPYGSDMYFKRCSLATSMSNIDDRIRQLRKVISHEYTLEGMVQMGWTPPKYMCA